MNFVQQLEESLRDLAAEARKRHPGVEEASERATRTLRQYQNAYATAVRQANAAHSQTRGSSKESRAAPTTKLFQSFELLHPFLLAANYPNASPKLLEISFRAMRLLIEADAVVPSDAIHLVRVWMIQAQVVAAYYQKHYNNKRNASSTTPDISVTGSLDSKEIAPSHSAELSQDLTEGLNQTTAPSTSNSSSTSSWFFWSSTSSTSGSSPNKTSSSIATPATTSAPASGSHVVSSSTGRTGHSSSLASVKQMEKLALDILSSLLELMQSMHRNYPEHLVRDTILWKHAFGVICLCLSPSMNHTSGGMSKKKASAAGSSGGPVSSVIQQAAHSTLSQILSLLYEPLPDPKQFSSSQGDNRRNHSDSMSDLISLQEATWQDLLIIGQSAIYSSSSPPPSVSSTLRGAFVLCRTTSAAISASSTSLTKKSTSSPTPVPPSPRLALNMLTKVYQNTEHQLSESVALETLQMTSALVQHVRTTSSVEVSQAILQQWVALVLMKLSPLYPRQSFQLIQLILQFVTTATDSFRSHPDFEDGFVYTQVVASTIGDSATIPTSRSAMTQPPQPPPQQNLPQQQQQVHIKPLVSGAILGKACLALDVLYRVMKTEDAAVSLVQDRSTVGLLTETLSDLATLAASCEGNMMQLVEFIQSRGGELGQDQLTNQATSSFLRRLEHDVDDDWDTLVDHASLLGEALWLALSIILQVMESVGHLPSKGESGVEIFGPALSVLQHYLKRFPGSDGVVRLALGGYDRLARLCFPSVDMQKALLTSLCKLSLPAWGKHDTSSLLEDHHVDSLLCLIGIMHNYYPYIATDWEIVLLTLEELSTMSIASPLLTEEAYHSALTISTLFGRIAKFSTCFSNDSLIHMVDALCQVIRTCLEDTDFLLDTNKGSQGRFSDSSQSEKSSESISRQIINIGVRAIYGSQSTSTDERASTSTHPGRPKSRFYEEYRRDFTERVAKSKCTIRLDSIGRVPFALALLADIAMANTFRYHECGEKISGSLSSLAASSAPARPFLMDTIAVLTMTHISSGDGSPAPCIGPGRIVFENPMQSQFLAVESIVKDRHASTGSNNAVLPQTEVLGPLCESLRFAPHPPVAESALETLYSVLESADHNLSSDIWSMVIGSLSTLSGNKSSEYDRSDSGWSKCCLEAFRCLKFIVNDFMDELKEENAAQIALLDCCAAFGSSRQDVNTSLTAIGMLWTIADQDKGTDSIDRALSKLVLLSSDSRPEVRNASVNTLFSCIVGRGSGFSADSWESCVQNTIFKVYNLVSSKARGEADTDVTENLPVPEKRKSRYKLSLHHSRDSESKQWIATQVVVLRGLIRVLRAFFPKLLDTTDIVAAQPEKAKNDDVPWFQDAWVQILDYAYEGATQEGGSRETLPIRSVGVELIALCCQLSSEGGLQSVAPANVGTNMEVVDGALRTVRETKAPTHGKTTRSHSLVCETARKNFFLEAFESLESYVGVVCNLPKADIDDAQLQVLLKFATGLTTLYDCSKDLELRPKSVMAAINSIEDEKEQDTKEHDTNLDERFAKMIVDVVNVVTPDSARFLNQAQRTSIQLLNSMGKAGSCYALRHLVQLGDVFFFMKKAEGLQTEQTDTAKQTEIAKSESVGLEAVKAIVEAVQESTQPVECQAYVLNEVLQVFQREAKDGMLAIRQENRYKIDYKRMIPVITSGLEACSVIEEKAGGNSSHLIARAWESLIAAFSIMITQVPMGKGMLKISRVPEVTELVTIIVPKTPPSFSAVLCDAMVTGTNNCLNVAELHERYSVFHSDSDVISHSKRHRDEVIQLFAKLCAGACKLQADNPYLRTMCQKTVEKAVRSTFSSEENGDSYNIDATLAICQCIREIKGTEILVPSVFPSLCKLISANDDIVRKAVAETLTSDKTRRLLKDAESRFERTSGLQRAQEQAKLAEEQAKRLSDEVNDLKQKNARLQRDLAALKAGATL